MIGPIRTYSLHSDSVGVDGGLVTDSGLDPTYMIMRRWGEGASICKRRSGTTSLDAVRAAGD